MRRAIVVLAALAGAAALTPATAGASVYSQVLRAYQAQGSIAPCEFSSAQLAAALKGVDTYGQQYFADFSNSVQSALAARAAGACAPGARLAIGSVRAPQAALPTSATAATDAPVPLPMLVLFGLSLVLALAAGAGALLRHGGWEPAWAAAWRHAWAEVEYRMAGGLSDLADRWRSRRG